MKYVARVRQVLQPGIHKVARIEDGRVVPTHDMPLPERVEIEVESAGVACMLFRYTRAGDVCGDTWHEDLAAAIDQAQFEYGLRREDFLEVHDGGTSTS